MTGYICINCGNKIDILYKQYSPSVLKLVSCDNCNDIADKYVEYDPIIIMIDLVLLRKEAYRHFLYNTEFKSHWKLAVILQIVESYSEWMLKYSPNKNNNKIYSPYSTDDLEFYRIGVEVVFKTICSMLIVFMLTLSYVKFTKGLFDQTVMLRVWKALVLSNFGVFLLLPSLIWDTAIQEFYLIFVSLYTTLSQLLAYTVAFDCPKMWSIFVIIASYFGKMSSKALYDVLYDYYYLFYNILFQ